MCRHWPYRLPLGEFLHGSFWAGADDMKLNDSFAICRTLLLKRNTTMIRRLLGKWCLRLFATLICGCSQYPTKAHYQLSDWGKLSQKADLDIASDILKSTDGVRPFTLDEPRFTLIVDKLNRNPALLKTMAIAYMDFAGAPKCDDNGFILRLVADMKHYDTGRSRRALNLFVCASIFNKYEWVVGLTWPGVEQRWADVSEWVGANGKYMIFDRSAKCFVIDEGAKSKDSNVGPSQQTWRECGLRTSGHPFVASAHSPGLPVTFTGTAVCVA
jgi:hypothetical protein